VLVHAAAGGVGSAAVVVARDLGAVVVATAGSAEKLALPLSLGATQFVTYDQLDEIEPVDVVFDPVGGQLFADSIKLLRPLGTAIAIGFAGGLWQPVDPALLVGRNVGVQGFYLGRLMQRQPATIREAAIDLLRLWSAGQVRPIVGATFPLDEAAEAHRLVESRGSTGKVVLVP
jgi:NADPH2:quinone reductase